MMERTVVRGLARARSVWALIDQGTVSLGAFLTNLLLARSLAPTEYGIYALILGVALFLNNIFFALVTYPLSITGAVADESELRRLTVQAVGVGCVVLVPLVAVIVCATVVLGRLELGPPAALALVLWQIQETLRRGLLAHQRHPSAVLGDSLSYLGQVGLLLVVNHMSHLSSALAFSAMATTSAVAIVVQAIQLRLRLAPGFALRDAVFDSLRTGRWIFLSNLLGGISFQALPWSLAWTRGPAETAAFQAGLNIVGVTNPVMFSMANVLLPSAAAAAKEKGIPGAYGAAVRSIAQGSSILVPFFFVIALIPEAVLSLVYGPDSQYRLIGGALRLLSLSYTLYYIGIVLVTVLSSLEQTRDVFVSQVWSALGGLVVGVPLTVWLGLNGTCMGVFCTHAVRAFVGGAVLLRVWPRSLVANRA